MGLATPAAIAVGLGRAAKKGILFRNARSLELFKNIETVVFDKTGTLTVGSFAIIGFESKILEENEFKRIIFSIEKYSTHPIAKTISAEWKTTNPLSWKKIEEIKGIGMRAEDGQGNIYQLGSYKIAANYTTDASHTAYLVKNNQLLGWLTMEDAIRAEARQVVDYLHSKNIRTVLLSGDGASRVNKVAEALGIKQVYAENIACRKAPDH
jgi:Cu+-exporting ATPase